MRRIFKNEIDEQEFKEKGYVKYQLADKATIDQLLQSLNAMRPADGFDPESNRASANPLNQSSYHCTFLDTNIDYKRTANDLIESVFQPLMDQVLNDYRILVSNFYVKPPGKGRFQIPQNWPTLKRFADTSLTIWCPLQDTNEVNGTIHIVEGSHKIVPDVAAATAPPFFANFEDELVNRLLTPVRLKAGECLIFCDSLIHWSPENNGTQPRRAIQIETLPREMDGILYYFDHGNPDVFELFKVDREFFIQNSIEAVIARPDTLESIGHVKNPNKMITVSEFEELVKNGNAIRKRAYAGEMELTEVALQ